MARWTIEVISAAERELRDLPDDLQGRFLVRLLIKNSQKTPRREVALAERRMKEQTGG
jgi:phage-related protein